MASVTSEDSSYQDIDELSIDEDGYPDLGKDAEIKKLYKNRRDRWVDELPEEDKEKVQKAVRVSPNLNYAIITRHYVEDEELCLDSVVVQNPVLKELLSQVFHDYPDLDAAFRSKKLIFEAPFRDFFYRWDQYEDMLRSVNDPSAKEYLQLFDGIIRPEIEPHVAEHKDILETGVVRFEDAWTLFYPGTEVYHVDDGQERIYRFERVSGRSSPNLSLSCKYISWNGFHFRWHRQLLTIFSYNGCKSITDLSVVPLHMQPLRAFIVGRLSDRGRKYQDLSGILYKSYTGYWKPRDPHFGSCASQSLEHGRILIDANTPHNLMPGMSNNYPPVEDPFAGLGVMPPQPLHDPFANLGQPCKKVKKKSKSKGKGKAPKAPRCEIVEMIDPFDPDYVVSLAPLYRFCRPTVSGFCMTSKQWGDFNVDDISEIEFNPATFKRLVLPADYKDLILAFVTSQMENIDEFDDIVDGKGGPSRGITLLLRGEPGVGKTLTAEAVAEEVKKPLYTLSAGDLGDNAQIVETNLRSMLDLCARWGAILLVDECDVFLEQRAATDIDRNKLVAVFLRLLEYYKGVIFLTTNRGGMIDRAFQSRIALVIHYPVLGHHAKRHIWETFVRPSVDFPQNDSDLTDADIDCLSRLDINGREIKNLVKTGRLLAKKKGMRLSMGHLRTVLRVQSMLLENEGDVQEDV